MKSELPYALHFINRSTGPKRIILSRPGLFPISPVPTNFEIYQASSLPALWSWSLSWAQAGNHSRSDSLFYQSSISPPFLYQIVFFQSHSLQPPLGQLSVHIIKYLSYCLNTLAKKIACNSLLIQALRFEPALFRALSEALFHIFSTMSPYLRLY